jgi:DNA-binding NarL/FixJ family response regulator
VVSINTVKTQVQSIFRKLGVKSRWEASEAAPPGPALALSFSPLAF